MKKRIKIIEEFQKFFHYHYQLSKEEIAKLETMLNDAGFGHEKDMELDFDRVIEALAKTAAKMRYDWKWESLIKTMIEDYPDLIRRKK